MRIAWTLVLGMVVAGVLALAPGGATSAGSAAGEVPLQLAWMETPLEATLDDILTGRAQPGFTPVLTQGLPFRARQDRVLWIRIRAELPEAGQWHLDRKSTRLNSSHVKISYAVFCLKKKKKN